MHASEVEFVVDKFVLHVCVVVQIAGSIAGTAPLLILAVATLALLNEITHYEHHAQVALLLLTIILL